MVLTVRNHPVIRPEPSRDLVDQGGRVSGETIDAAAHHGGKARSDLGAAGRSDRVVREGSAQAQGTYKRQDRADHRRRHNPVPCRLPGAAQAALAEELDLVPAPLIAALGLFVVVLEGVQHLNQCQKTWLDYRSTAEALKHEKFLFLAGAGPNADVDDRRARLAERIEELIASEHSRWYPCAPLARVARARSGRAPLRSGSAGSLCRRRRCPRAAAARPRAC
jgi:Protein of unknown function (DUF4231)